MSTQPTNLRSLSRQPRARGLWLKALAAWLVLLVIPVLNHVTPALADPTNPDFVPPEITLPYANSGGQTQAAASGQQSGQSGQGQAPGRPSEGFAGFQLPTMPSGGNGMNPFLMKGADRLRQPPGAQFPSKGMSPPGAAAGGPPAGSSGFGQQPAAQGSQMPQNGQPATLSTQAKIADPTAVIATSKGNITIMLFRQYAPNTVAAFMQMVKEGFYNGLTFHRVEPGFVIQGGCPRGDGKGNYPPNSNQPRYLPLETSPNVSHNAAGVVAMAHQAGNVNSASCQFYITLAPHKELDGQYTIFGGVKEGMDVVNRITKGDQITSITVSQ